jgi:nucleotide-binding universal stress UspA family protein
LIAYDASANSRHSIEVAAKLFPWATAELVHAWEPVTSLAARSAVYAVGFDHSPGLLERERGRAAEVAEEGTGLVRGAGLEVTGRAIAGSGPLWETIVTRAEEVGPDLIVMGTRGLSGVRSVLRGSISHGVTVHSSFPVLTVPMPAGGG